MIYENLLDRIGFTPEDKKDYEKYKALSDGVTEAVAFDYMSGKISFNEALEKVKSLKNDKIGEYALNMLFFLDCTGYLYPEKYAQKGWSEALFVNAMRDLKSKLDECRDVMGCFGTFVPEWYEGFYVPCRVAPGRLQYDIKTHEDESVKLKNYEIKKGDLILNCHIPGSSYGPLLEKDCIESYKMAYELFKGQIRDKVLVIRCCSWLLFPAYQSLFGDKSNTYKFAEKFEIVESRYHERFLDGWRIFNQHPYDGTANLPRDTRMRRAFIDYIDNVPDSDKKYGAGLGYLLFDGESIITHR
ncbi:MAG: hypothetical protein E7588_05550 [Ruminococcaceae bacterium]|nr:hypothetical protein [Oscillospiraceae bacterium]